MTYDYSSMPGGISGCNRTLGNKIVVKDNIELEVYPNPVTDILFIRTNQKAYKLELINVVGEVVWTGTGSQIELNYPKGIYFLKLQSENNAVTKKVVLK